MAYRDKRDITGNCGEMVRLVLHSLSCSCLVLLKDLEKKFLFSNKTYNWPSHAKVNCEGLVQAPPMRIPAKSMQMVVAAQTKVSQHN